MGIMDAVRAEQPIIRAARFSFCIAVAGVTLPLTAGLVALAWLLINFGYSGKIDGLDQQIAVLQSQMAGRDGRITELEKKIADDAEMVARALNFYQQSIAQKVQELPESLGASPASVEIIGGGNNSFAKSVARAFVEGGWMVNSAEPAGYADLFAAVNAAGASPRWSESGIYLSLPENESGRTVRRAFDKADIPYVLWEHVDAGGVPKVLITTPGVASALATPSEAAP